MAEASDKTAPDATSSSAPPTLRHGRFALLAELGSGSSGTVFRASLREDYKGLPAGTELAVKFLRQDLLGNDRARERLVGEGELGLQVQHPNVAAMYGIETMTVLGLPLTYLVMEYVRGTTLRAFLQQSGPPVEDLTRRIGADAASGLQALHRRGVVHRDLKPENLILTPDGQVKLVDLGLARPFGARGMGSASSSGGGLFGTVAYAAPEALKGQPTTPRSDLYSLGVLLFEVATGKHPFAACKSPDEMLYAHLHTAPDRPSHLRPRMTPLLEQLILDLLQKEPDQRPRDAAEVARALQQGERSDWWRRHEQQAPLLASRRRLAAMRRPADTAFHGRQDELARLDARLQAARRGQGSAVCISGPEGIGRRRLCDEAMARWLDAGEVLFLGGTADPNVGRGEPFASTMLDFLLRGELRDSPNANLRAEARARAELGLDETAAAALAAVAAGHSKEPPEVRADRLASALLALPRKDRVLVLRVEDAEKLDTSARLVLARLLHDAGRKHLLLLLTAGPEGAPPSFADATERLDLHGLAETEFLQVGRSLFRDGEVDEGFLLQAHQTLSGSPGNLQEALEHLVQQGGLHGRAGDYHGLQPGVDLRPAPRHVARFQERVARLLPEQRAILEAAAVLGDRPAVPDIAALAGTQELQVLETLSLFRGRIIRARGGEVAFRHRDFRLALFEAMGQARRSALHLAAAERLAAQGADPLAVGMHRSQALDHQGCLDPLLTGLDNLVRSGSRRTALRIQSRLRLHLDHVEPTPDNRARRLRFLLLSGHARRNAWQGPLAAQSFRAAETLAAELGDAAGRGEALTGCAAVAVDEGAVAQARALLDGAHAELDSRTEQDRDRILAARAHGLRARVELYLGCTDAGLRHVQTALRLLPDDDQDLGCHFRIDLARLEALGRHFPTALKTMQKVEGERAARSQPRVRLRLLLYRGQIRAQVGDDGALADLRAAAAEAERLSLPAYGARARLFLGERALFRGRTEEAANELQTAQQLALAGGDRVGATLAAIHLSRLLADGGDHAAAVAEFGLPELTATWLCTRCEQQRQHDDQAAAEATAEAALAIAAAADLPIGTHLLVLRTAGKLAVLRGLLRQIAERMPDRNSRRNVQAQWAAMTR